MTKNAAVVKNITRIPQKIQNDSDPALSLCSVSANDYATYERRDLDTKSGASVQQRFIVWDAESCRNRGDEGAGGIDGDQVRGRKEAGGDIP